MLLETTTSESLELLASEVRDLVRVYPVTSLSDVLGHLAAVQDSVFTLLERPQRADQTRRLYFLAGILCGAMGKASHDSSDPVAAITQLRTAKLCAEQANHDGLHTWVAGLQALVAYWADRPVESLQYIGEATLFAARSKNTSSVWLAASAARARAVMGDAKGTWEALRRAEQLRETACFDEVDELGGMAEFAENRQTYFAADALVHLLPENPTEAVRVSDGAVCQYLDSKHPDFAFGDAAGSRVDLAVSRIAIGEQEGALDAFGPVLDLPPAKRINGVVRSVNRLRHALIGVEMGTAGRDTLAAVENFTRNPLPRVSR